MTDGMSFSSWLEVAFQVVTDTAPEADIDRLEGELASEHLGTYVLSDLVLRYENGDDPTVAGQDLVVSLRKDGMWT